MNKLQRGAMYADLFLINRVFMPLAWWIDWRFHYSPYQQAYRVFQFAQFMQIVSTVATSYRLPWVSPLMAGISLVLFYAYRTDYRRLEKCQRQFEADPARLCREQAFYMAPFFLPPPRLMLLAGGFWMIFLMFPLAIGSGNWDAMLNCWVGFNGVAWYLAGAFPPQRPRREKQTYSALVPVGAT